MKILAVIPARGGSKGLPRKNLAEFLGLPLLAHSIKCAQLCPEVHRVVVSTEDAEIKSVALQYGAEVVDRPAELATDSAPILPVIKHAAAELDGDKGFASILLLQPSCPGRLPEHVAAAGKLLTEEVWTVALSICEFEPNPDFVGGRLYNGVFYRPLRAERRQEVRPVYRVNGALYLYERRWLRELKDPDDLWLRPRAVVMPENLSFDIDTPADLARARACAAAGLIKLPWVTT